MIFEFLFGALTMGCGIYLGYVMGKNSSIIPEETKRQVKRLIQALPIKNDLGAVMRPDAHQIENFNNPIQAEEEKAMSETFAKIVK